MSHAPKSPSGPGRSPDVQSSPQVGALALAPCSAFGKEGPTTRTIPAHRTTTCGRCKYHECTGGLYTRIGGGGYREWACNHPEAYPPETDAAKAEIRGMLRALDKGGRPIGRTDATPHWCPFLREQNKKDEPRP